MRLKHYYLLAALNCALVTPTMQIARGATLNFEPPALAPGTRFGASEGNTPGQTVFTQDGISMSVENFHAGSFTGFFRAEAGGIYADAFPTQELSLDNINTRFDFTNVGFPVVNVTVDYVEFGGVNNFTVNDGTIIQISPLSSLPTNVNGVIVTADQDSIMMTGVIHSFLIGGQELAIDNIVAVPEPATVLLLLVPGAIFACRRRACHKL